MRFPVSSLARVRVDIRVKKLATLEGEGRYNRDRYNSVAICRCE